MTDGLIERCSHELATILQKAVNKFRSRDKSINKLTEDKLSIANALKMMLLVFENMHTYQIVDASSIRSRTEKHLEWMNIRRRI